MYKKITDQLIEEAKKYVFGIMEGKPFTDLFYHSIHHTKDVLSNVELIGNYFRLSHDDINILKMSALFHDLGFLEICDGHEEISAGYAKKFLSEKNIEPGLIEIIVKAILATKVPQSPYDLLSRILCDADLMNLSSEEAYLDDIERLRKEWIFCGKEKHTKEEFYKISLDFLKSHHFHTDFGKEQLKPKKDRTIKILQELSNKNSH